MLTLISPAKNLNFEPVKGKPKSTRPVLHKDTAALSEVTRKLTRSKLKGLMGISDNLADLNFERFQAFSTDGQSESQKSAVLAFNGDVYLGLDAGSLSNDDFKFAQNHLRILSGFYGILRPLDAIQPYRLEMGSRLKNPRGRNLYDFWGEAIAQEIRKSLKRHDEQIIVNLASIEYFSAVDQSVVDAKVVTPIFKEEKDGKLRQLQFYAKRARGLMARWIIQERIESAEALPQFSVEGYKFAGETSKPGELLFTRPQPAPKKSLLKKPAAKKSN